MIPEICRAGGWGWHRPKRQDLTGPPGAWRAKFTACSQVNVAVSRARRRLYVIGDCHSVFQAPLLRHLVRLLAVGVGTTNTVRLTVCLHLSGYMLYKPLQVV
jgi:hypothetical protein